MSVNQARSKEPILSKVKSRCSSCTARHVLPKHHSFYINPTDIDGRHGVLSARGDGYPVSGTWLWDAGDVWGGKRDDVGGLADDAGLGKKFRTELRS